MLSLISGTNGAAFSLTGRVAGLWDLAQEAALPISQPVGANGFAAHTYWEERGREQFSLDTHCRGPESLSKQVFTLLCMHVYGQGVTDKDSTCHLLCANPLASCTGLCVHPRGT